MARVQFLEKAGLPSGHQHIYDETAVSRGGVQRNFKALLNSPMATSKMAILGGYVRCGRPPRVKALAVLAATREIDGDYVWTVNQRLGEAGVVDLLMLIGYYHSLSHTLSALEVMPEAGSVLTN